MQGTVIGDADPQFDDCSSPKGGLLAMSGRNVGDLLNAKDITWGWFQGGFRPTRDQGRQGGVRREVDEPGGREVPDYSPHHEPFQYFRQTANPHHLPPSSVDMIGRTDQANHQYDLADFFEVLSRDRLPAVSFVKAKRYQDGHAGYSDPIDEQAFLVALVNAVELSPSWKDTAIIVAYDDSDGWYDHVMPPILKGSAVGDVDALNGSGQMRQRGLDRLSRADADMGRVCRFS